MVNDPLVREAEFTRKATREARPQAWAAYLPQIGGSWSKTQGRTAAALQHVAAADQRPDQPGQLHHPARRRAAATRPPTRTQWGVQLRQSIFNWGQLVGLHQAGKIAAQADADYGVAQQDLALRVATRYFDVLAAQDNVQAQQASLDAISRQLEQADKRFEVGLIAITDVQEARAARDTAAADLIAAKRQLATSQELLREITDMQYAVLATPRAHHAARHPRARRPAEVGRGVDGAEPGADLEPARRGHRARRRARAASAATCRRSTWSSASRTSNRTSTNTFGAGPGLSDGGTLTSNQDGDTDKSIVLQVTVPIWSSGGTQSRVRQSSYRWQAAKQRLERVSRETERAARDAYLGVVSEISRVQALKQALESSADRAARHRSRL